MQDWTDLKHQILVQERLLEYLLRLVKQDVGEREAVDLDNLVAHGEAAVAVDAAARLDALHHEAPVLVAGDHVNAEGTCMRVRGGRDKLHQMMAASSLIQLTHQSHSV